VDFRRNIVFGLAINPTIFIPRLLNLHADSLSGETIKPVLTFEE
jgi:hypothetical protein